MDIELNVTRSRITLLGFTMTVALFAMDTFTGETAIKQTESPWDLLFTYPPVFSGFFFCVIAAVLFIISQDIFVTAIAILWKK